MVNRPRQNTARHHDGDDPQPALDRSQHATTMKSGIFLFSVVPLWAFQSPSVVSRTQLRADGSNIRSPASFIAKHQQRTTTRLFSSPEPQDPRDAVDRALGFLTTPIAGTILAYPLLLVLLAGSVAQLAVAGVAFAGLAVAARWVLQEDDEEETIDFRLVDLFAAGAALVSSSLLVPSGVGLSLSILAPVGLLLALVVLVQGIDGLDRDSVLTPQQRLMELWDRQFEREQKK